MRPNTVHPVILTLAFFVATSAMDNLRVAFHWKQLDFAYPSESEREDAVTKREFVPENNLPLGLEVYGDRLFITVPRWKSGVAASLAYIKLTGSLLQFIKNVLNLVLVQSLKK